MDTSKRRRSAWMASMLPSVYADNVAAHRLYAASGWVRSAGLPERGICYEKRLR